jgi:hypothetical protein
MSMFRAFVLASLFVAALGGCASKKSGAAQSAVDTLDVVLAPDAVVSALQKVGGGHFHSTALLRVEASRKADPAEGKPASPPAVTTTTDLWLDRQGNFRLLETNDQDGGREIVRVGRSISVALRYGKLVKRTAEDAETAGFLAEAVGAPRTAWEIVRRQVEVRGSTGGPYALALGQRLADLPTGFSAGGALQKWRDSIEVKSLGGSVGLNGVGAGRVLVTFECKATFHATRDALPDVLPEVLPIDGEVAVSAIVDQIGKVPDVTMPDAETLHLRQRTILEEKALLGGIRSSVSLPPPPKKKAGP